MSQQFNSIKVSGAGRSTFNLSHHQVMTSDFGYLTPICVRDMVPNDDYVVKPSIFCRLAPLAFPAYARVKVKVSSFFVPYRILYPHWSEWITQSRANNTIPPYFRVGNLRNLFRSDPQFEGVTTTSNFRGIFGRLAANLGLNPELFINDPDDDNGGISSEDRIAAFRFLAYYRIWLDWFMDSNLYDHSQMVASFNDQIKNGGLISPTTFLLTRNCCYGKDYFTTAKLHPQAGSDPSRISVNVGQDVNPGLKSPLNNQFYRMQLNPDTGQVKTNGYGTDTDGLNSNSSIGQFTVEELRAAVSLQRYLERNNYVGSKVINQLLVHFGIAPTPERLDMSEFLGGSDLNIQIGDVTSTTPHSTVSSEEVLTIGLGAQAGKGVAAGSSETIRYHAKEHGVFMTLMYIVPDTAYYQGIPKQFSLGVTGDPLDYYTPEFENLGFQEILNKEVFVPSSDTGAYEHYDPDGIFGYAPRYAYLKWQSDILSGDFLGVNSSFSDYGRSMDAWHLFRKLVYNDDNPLALNSNFVELSNINNNYDRIFQITDPKYDHFYFNIDVDVKATRPMVGFMEPSVDENNRGDGNTINLPYGGTRL